MTLSTTARQVTYTGNGSTFVWDFNFKVIESDHIGVQVLNTVTNSLSVIAAGNYSVSGIGNESGGSVTYPTTGSALSSDEKIIIVRTVPYVQETDIQNQEGFFPEVVEDQFDLVVMMIQQLTSDFSRAITIPLADGDLDMELPIAADRAGKYLSFTSTGTPNLTGDAPTEQYQGAHSSANEPTTRADGSPLQEGDLYFNTTDNKLYVWDGTSWVAVSSSGSTFDINGLVAETDPAVGDFAGLYDVSASDMRKMTLANMLKVINSLTEETSIVVGDYIVYYDTSASAVRRISIGDLLAIINTLTTTATTDADNDKLFIWDDSVAAIRGILLSDIIPTDSFATGLLHVRDEKSSGSDGGTFTSGSWQTRTLNTVRTNKIAGASLTSDQITLPEGEYFIQAFAPAKGVQVHKAKLRNTTDGADVLIGSNARTSDSDNTSSVSVIAGRFSLAAEKTLEIQHQGTTTNNSDGFGEAVGLSVAEVYTEVMIWNVESNAGVGRGVDINTQTGTSYTLEGGDADDIVEMDNASANTVTIPAAATTDFPVGTIITITQKGAGTTTVEGATGVTVNGVSAGSAALNAQWDGVSIYKRDTDEWVMQGAHGGVS